MYIQTDIAIGEKGKTMNELCTDNRFELIAKYKEKLIEATNIEMAQDEMEVIDDILFRFWQMGWLDKLDADTVPVVRCKDCKHKQGSACDYSAVWLRPNGFCHWGERRADDNH